MKNESFQTIVDELQKFRYKILATENIQELIKNVMWTSYTESRMYKTFYYLKGRGYLVDLKKNFYYIKSPEDSVNEEDVVDKHYRTILSNKIKNITSEKRYIWWLKALELNSDIRTIPDEILIVNSKKQGTESLILEKKILLKTYTTKDKNLFTTFYKASKMLAFNKCKIAVAVPELAIIETLYNSSAIQKTYGEELIKKRLRKNKKNFNIKIIENIIKEWKHNSSINRLAKLAESIDGTISNQLKELIKKYGYTIH